MSVQRKNVKYRNVQEGSACKGRRGEGSRQKGMGMFQ